MLQDPRVRGVSQALDAGFIRDDVMELYPMVDLFLVMVDRDCDRDGNVAKAAALQRAIEKPLLVCVAIEEVEAWMLYLHRDALSTHLKATFRDVRENCDPKEAFADPLLRQLGWAKTVGKGRKQAMRQLGSSWRGLVEVCDELADFRDRIATVVKEIHA